MHKLHATFFSVLLFLTTDLVSREVRSIRPPNLSTIAEQYECYRPMREGSPCIRVEYIGNKTIGHNYGHGGSGWTLRPGITQHLNELFIQSCPEIDPTASITIIGAGAIGFFTAYNLINQYGFKNITIVAESFDNLTSHKAGGLLAPVSMSNTPETEALINKIGIDAYRFYASIARKEQSDFHSGARIMATYFTNRDDSGLEPYVGVVMAPAKDVVLDFGNGTTREMVAYDDGIFIDTATMMKQLQEYLVAHGVRFIQKKISSFDDIADRYIIDCTGLGAKDLNGDDAMVSVQGHLIMLDDQNPEDLEYMLLVYLGEGTTESGQPITRSLYLFPKKIPGSDARKVGVLGGTFAHADSSTPNTAEYDTILANARSFYGI